MKTEINTGGPAFPHSGRNDGMALRDYFAAAALPAVFKGVHDDGAWNGLEINDAIAKDAYSIADAMLKARES